jgi:hypothetical protein
MSGITEMLLSQIGGGQMQSIAKAIGASPAVTERAVEAALPALVGGLARNATASPEGAASLAGALDRDHDGSILDDLGGLLGGGSSGLGGLLGGGGGGSSSGMGGLLGAAGSLLGGGGSSSPASAGAGILANVFGAGQNKVESAVGSASGLDIGQAGKLMAMLAPIVMGVLGKMKSQQGLDASGLAGLLGQERDDLAAKTPALGGLLGMLDSDGDGDLGDDVAELGAGLLKGFLNRR